MAWRRVGDKLLSEPMLVRSLTIIWTWTTADFIHWRIYAALGGDELTAYVLHRRSIIHNFDGHLVVCLNKLLSVWALWGTLTLMAYGCLNHSLTKYWSRLYQDVKIYLSGKWQCSQIWRYLGFQSDESLPSLVTTNRIINDWFPSCYNVTHVFCPSLFVFCREQNYYPY